MASVITYGIPGHMVIAKSVPHALRELADPVPGIQKQLVVRSLETTTIFYEHAGTLAPYCLKLPASPTSKAQFTKFVFYCHTPKASEIGDENYQSFLQHAIPNITIGEEKWGLLVCVLLNTSDVTNLGYSWLGPNIIQIKRPNSGWDFGAYADGLHFVDIEQHDQKYHAIFLNDTMCGPMFPWWLKPKPVWISVWISMITEDVKLAGTAINANPFPKNGLAAQPHVQSMLLVTDNIGLEIAMKAKVFSRRMDKDEVIADCEIGFSAAILRAGYNIDCAAELLHGYDYRDPNHFPNQSGDVSFPGRYAGSTLQPFETIFTKTNRINRGRTTLILQAQARTQNKDIFICPSTLPQCNGDQ